VLLYCAMTFASAKEMLSSTLVKAILKDKEFLVTIQGNESVAAALNKFQQSKISSIPVLHEHLTVFNSFVDNVDLCTFAMEVAGRYIDVDQAQNAFVNASCSLVANTSRKNPFYQIQNTDTLKSCMGKMVALSNIHRLPVIDLQGSFVGVISQSQVVNLINDHLHLFSMITNKTIIDMRLGIKQVYSVKLSAPIKDAFKLMVDNKVSGVAVVEDNDNILCGNISASDIKVIVDGNEAGGFGKLNLPVKELLGETMTKKEPVAVSITTTISQVFKLMCEEKIHRTFVVKDRSKELVGVISLVDLLDLVLHYV